MACRSARVQAMPLEIIELSAHIDSMMSLLTIVLLAPWQHLGLGEGFVCLQATDGRVTCPGLNAALPAEPLTRFSVGAHHACGLRHDATLVCWGADVGRVPDGAFAAVEVGDTRTCAVRPDGELVCWAGADTKTLALPPGRFRHIVHGRDLTCTLDEAGALACFGRAYPQYLDDLRPFASPGFYSYFPVRTGRPGPDATWAAPHLDAGPFTALSLVDESVCALREGGILRCFGKVIPPAGEFRALSGHCAVDAAGEATCFGGWGPPERLHSLGPVKVFSARGPHWAALTADGRLTYNAPLPRPLAGPVVAVGGRNRHVNVPCTLHADGGLLCGNHLRHGPTPFVGLDRGGENCGITADGTLHCLGLHLDSQDRLPGGVRRLDTEVGAFEALDGRIAAWRGWQDIWPPRGSEWKTLPAGRMACGVLTSGRIHCNSLNKPDCRDAAAPLETLPVWQRDRPVCVPLPTHTDFVAADSGHRWGCGLRAGGEVVCWGTPQWLGVGNPPPGPWPPPPGPFDAVAVGDLVACARRPDGTVHCFGPSAPRGTMGRFLSVSRAGEGVCGVRVDGAVACWGGR